MLKGRQFYLLHRKFVDVFGLIFDHRLTVVLEDERQVFRDVDLLCAVNTLFPDVAHVI